MQITLPGTAIFCCALALPAQEPAADALAALAALPAHEPVERGVRVLVRDDKGKPDPGAILVVVAAGARYSDALAQAATASPGDAIAQMARACAAAGGERFAVDERGATALARTSATVLAWRDGMFATKSFSVTEGQPTPRVELALASPWVGRAEVVDASGRPAAGVPIGVASGNSTNPRHTTDAEGCATMRVCADRVTANSTVRLLIAANTRIEVPAPANGGTARLQLPQCGSVHATYSGPLLPGSTLNWSLRRADRSALPTATGAREATFAFVQVGYDGELQVVADGATIRVPVRGVRVDAATEVVAARKEGSRYLVLRPLSPDGEPAPKSFVETRWSFEHGSSRSSATTNAEGWLEVEVPEHAKSARLQLVVRTGRWTGPVVGTTEIEIAAADKGRVDKGEWKLAKPEVALAGRVVDAGNQPLRGIQLYATGEYGIQAMTDADGRFEFALPAGKATQLTVNLMSEGWFFTDPPAKSREFATGEPALLVLQPAGRVRFSAPGLELGVSCDLQIRLEPVDGDGPRVDVSLRLDRDFLMLPAGNWHFVVTNDDQEVHRLENVRVDAGVEVHDPRFMTFAWQAFASLLVVHVEDANGTPTDDCTIWRRRGNQGRGTVPSNGASRLLVADDGATVHVEPRDQKLPKLDLGPARGEYWVRLGAGPRLLVRVEPAPKIPANAQLVARISGRDPQALDAAGQLIVWLDKVGERSVQLALRVGDTTRDLPLASRSVDVATGGSALVFPGGAALQEAIDRAAK